MTGAADLMVMGAATVLLVAGSAKIVQPAPVAATLAELWQAIGGRPRGSGWQFSGRLLGVFEVVLACVIVIERSAAAALALLLFAVGLAVVGVVGIASTSKVSCAVLVGRTELLGGRRFSSTRPRVRDGVATLRVVVVLAVFSYGLCHRTQHFVRVSAVNAQGVGPPIVKEFRPST